VVPQWDHPGGIVLAELSLAFLPSRERRLESVAQGEAFAEAAETAWHISGFAALRKAWPNPVTYPVAVAVAAAEASIPLGMALPAYLHANAANLISAGVRLIPLGQTDGQRVQVKLEVVVDRVARAAMTSDLEDLGGAAFRSDLASLAHETQYTRLFRSLQIHPMDPCASVLEGPSARARPR
jgi:urease accessory protein